MSKTSPQSSLKNRLTQDNPEASVTETVTKLKALEEGNVGQSFQLLWVWNWSVTSGYCRNCMFGRQHAQIPRQRLRITYPFPQSAVRDLTPPQSPERQRESSTQMFASKSRVVRPLPTPPARGQPPWAPPAAELSLDPLAEMSAPGPQELG